jgi:hypothetical protein
MALAIHGVPRAAGRPQDLADVKGLLELDAGGTDGGRDDG